MLPQNGKTLLKIVIIVIILTSIAGYSLYQSQNLIKGPQLTIEYPTNGATVDNPSIEIKGKAYNVAYISLNDRQIFIDKDGAFNEELLLGSGYNIWKLEAKDKFGRIVSKKIELVLKKS
ncbi:MAG: hypothetical protein M3Q63_03960 [bacterium]|nr:hypothetical protein [bacterium]